MEDQAVQRSMLGQWVGSDLLKSTWLPGSSLVITAAVL